MYTTHLRKVGGSVMLAVPPAILDMLQITAGSTVGLMVENGQLLVKPSAKPRYTLDDLLAQCDPDAPISDEEREWLDAPRAGGEMI